MQSVCRGITGKGYDAKIIQKENSRFSLVSGIAVEEESHFACDSIQDTGRNGILDIARR